MTPIASSATASSASIRLSIREKLSYGVGDMANALAISSTAFFLLYYLTTVVGLEPYLAGIALLIGRVWDAILDPVVGWLTDRTQTRWGKRRPYLLFGAAVYGASFFTIWAIPEFGGMITTFVYVTAMLILFNTGLSLVFIPYQTLTAAMTSDYNERTSLTGYRMVLSQIAFLLGAILPEKILQLVHHSAADSIFRSEIFGAWAGSERLGYMLSAALLGVMITICVWIAFLGTTEREEVPEEHADFNLVRYLGQVIGLIRSSRPFRASLMVKVFSTCATTLIAAQLKFYIMFVLGMELLTAKIIGILFVAAILATPIWVLISKRFGKTAAFQFGMSGYICVLMMLLFLGPESGSIVYLFAILAGSFHAAALLIPWTIIPDVVEDDELTSGTRREGLLYGVTAFAYKVGSGFAIFLAGVGLSMIGFVETAAVQSPHTITGLAWITAVAPAALLLLAIWAIRQYPITHEIHQEIVRQLRLRHASKSDQK